MQKKIGLVNPFPLAELLFLWGLNTGGGLYHPLDLEWWEQTLKPPICGYSYEFDLKHFVGGVRYVWRILSKKSGLGAQGRIFK